MKYRIVVQKERRIMNDGNDIMRGNAFDEGYDNVFTVDINADDAVELAQHLWDIQKRKENQANQAKKNN